MSKSISTGVTSNFKIENHENVETRLLKKTKKEKRECKENLESNADCDADGCPNCGRKFLRASWLERHVVTCKSTKDKERKRKTAEEVWQSLPVREALGSAAKLRKLDPNVCNFLSDLSLQVPESILKKKATGSQRNKKKSWNFASMKGNATKENDLLHYNARS